MIIPFDQLSGRELQTGSDVPSRHNQKSHSGWYGKSTHPNRTESISWAGHDRFPKMPWRCWWRYAASGAGQNRDYRICVRGCNFPVWRCNCDNRCCESRYCQQRQRGQIFHRCLLEIRCHLHFQKARIAPLLQRQCHENFCIFYAQPRFLPAVGLPKYASSNTMTPYSWWVSSRCPIVMRIRLSMNQAVLIGHSEHPRQLNSWNASLVLTHIIECQKPLRQRHMGLPIATETWWQHSAHWYCSLVSRYACW